MRIGVDCIKWDPSDIGGVNSYINGILAALVNQEKHEIIIFCSQNNFNSISENFKKKNVRLLEVLPQKRNVFRSLINKFIFNIYPNFKLWVFFLNFFDRENKALIDSNCDLLYCPRTLLTFHHLTVPTLLSMHDIQQVHFRDFFTPPEHRHRYVVYGASAYKASYFQSSSNFIKKDLLNHFKNLSKEQFVIIPEGVDVNKFSGVSASTGIRQKYNLPDKFLFYPAQLWKHKNHLHLLKAVKKIKDEKGIEIPLILTGKEYSAAQEIFNYIQEENLYFVKHLGLIEMNDLIQLYHEAWYLVMPSLFESSSLPVLEAAAAGLPIIASEIESIKEMNERFQMSLFDPADVNSMANTIYKAWSNDQDREKQIVNNKRNILLNDWSKIGEQYLAFIEQIIEPTSKKAVVKASMKNTFLAS